MFKHLFRVFVGKGESLGLMRKEEGLGLMQKEEGLRLMFKKKV